MISNTELYFVKMNEFQDKRTALRTDFEKKMKSLERYKGSAGFEEETKKAKQAYEASLKDLIAEYRPSVMTILGGMKDAIGRRTMPTLTAEQTNLLSVLALRKKTSFDECQRIAMAMNGNPLALETLTELARERGVNRSFTDMCSELSSSRAYDLVEILESQSEDFLQYDTTRASRIASEYYARNGIPASEPKARREFTDKSDCYSTFAGMDEKTLALFSEVVDG